MFHDLCPVAVDHYLVADEVIIHAPGPTPITLAPILVRVPDPLGDITTVAVAIIVIEVGAVDTTTILGLEVEDEGRTQGLSPLLLRYDMLRPRLVCILLVGMGSLQS
jgi:hypothetical protein